MSIMENMRLVILTCTRWPRHSWRIARTMRGRKAQIIRHAQMLKLNRSDESAFVPRCCSGVVLFYFQSFIR